MIKHAIAGILALSAPANAADWLCKGAGLELRLSPERSAATLQGEPLAIESMQEGRRASGERWLEASVLGPASWNDGTRTNDAHLVIRFRTALDRYEATVRRHDTYTGHNEFLPHLTLTCDVPRADAEECTR